MSNHSLLFRSVAAAIVIILCNIQSTLAQSRLYTNMFPLGDVALTDQTFSNARDTNIRTLLQYDVDRLLAPYRKEAGLPQKTLSYPNWIGLDGHIGGHYLSALAIHVAATNNRECKKRMDYMITELDACQRAHSTHRDSWRHGYVGGVPDSEKVWSAFKEGDFTAYRSAWVPWYNLHKMYAGLRDAWLYAGSTKAKQMFLQFCDWGISITAQLDETQMQMMLDIEHGGMNEIFADAYQMTGDEKYLTAAKRFSHHTLLHALASGIDNLDNKHANTQVPKAIGFQRIGELSNDKQYLDAGRFFWETVTANRTLAFGGNSRREFFPSATACSDFINEAEGPESCNSYNMLKLSEALFRKNNQAYHIDYYERTLYNHILSTQHPGHGGYVYFTPVRPRHYRVYSSPNQAMWCCVGSGMENHGKYNQFIYTHQSDSLFVNLFIASELNWRSKKIMVRQETSFPEEEKTRLVITKGSANFTLMIRYPSWVKDQSLEVFVNDKKVEYNSEPSSFIAINRRWAKGDIVTIKFLMNTKLEHLPHVSSYVALMHGPILLAAKTGEEDMKGLVADDGRWSHIAHGKRLPIDQAPILVEDDKTRITDLVRMEGKPLRFTFRDVGMINPIDLTLEPFYSIHDARYMMYWLALTKEQYATYLDSIASYERERLALQQRTIDFIAPGEQQPEADHELSKANSRTGNHLGEFWRDAADDGFFSYNLSTGGETNLSLRIRYWGAEWGNRKFHIYIDDELLTTEDNTGRWNQSSFFEVEYAVPDSLIAGKQRITVRFQALPGNTAGAVYYVRLIRGY